MAPTLQIQLLGDFRLLAGEAPITTVTVPRLQSLLAYLVLHSGAPRSRSQLAFLLWPDSDEAQAHTNLRQLLFHLRQSLPDADRYLHADKSSLHWRPSHADAPWTLDVVDLEAAVARATEAEQAQDASVARQELERAMRRYQGDLLPGCYDEWILPERDRLRQLFLHGAETLIALLEREGDDDGAILTAQQLLRQDPLHEAAYRQLMRLLARRGDRAAALRVYHTCTTTLERELGAEPSEATRAIYESLSRTDVLTGPPVDRPASRGAIVPLLGRRVEWRLLQGAWRQAADGNARVVILTGEAGIAKTRLAEELEAWVSRQGMTTASARGYVALGNLAYAPVTTWLRAEALQTGLSALDPAWLTEVARLAPEVLARRPRLPRPAALTEGWQRQRFFEALARAVLSARPPLLLLLDDLQWCDQETLDWLQYLFHFAPGARLLLIGTVRVGEALAGDPLIAFLGALQRDGLVTEVPLGPLSTDETASLAERILGCELDAGARDRLFHETEGNPLFVVELARAGTQARLEDGQPLADRPLPLLSQPASSVPPSVQTVLATRLARLSPSARDVANAAAVIGREFSSSVLARASADDENTVVRGLDELWRRRIVREQGAGETYDFSHDKLREQVYRSMSPAYRRLLHRRVAEALEAVYSGDRDAVCGQIAEHYERAGLPDRAIPFHQRAGEVAARIYANPEAINAFERAIALLEARVGRPAGGDRLWETAVQVYESLGDVSTGIGRYREATDAYQHALTWAPPTEHLRRARLQRKRGHSGSIDFTRPDLATRVAPRQAFQEAESELTRAPDPASPAWDQEWIELQFAQVWPPMRWSADEMTTAIEKARPVVERHGTEEQRRFLLHAAGTRDLIRNRYVSVMTAEKLAAWRDTVASIERTGNLTKLGIYRVSFGVSLWCSGWLDDAEAELEKGLRVGERIGSARLQNHGLTFLALVHRRRGQTEPVRAALDRALTVGAARNNRVLIGHRAWIAWRDGNLVEAEADGRASLEDWQLQQPISPFLWTGLWPLLGVALARGNLPEAMGHLRLILDPTQQPPPKPLSALLGAALHAWDTGRSEEAARLLQRAVPLATELGYL
ncbi:MAG: ATP-binding protein [Chloroflexota bacterium]